MSAYYEIDTENGFYALNFHHVKYITQTKDGTVYVYFVNNDYSVWLNIRPEQLKELLDAFKHFLKSS